MHDLMIIGGGPAGLAASVYAARKQLKTILLSGDIGGQVNLTLGVENYLGYQFIEGRHTKVPQIGTVEIGDDVEIGANCAIDRAKFHA